MIQLHRHLTFPRNVYTHAVFVDEGRLEDSGYGVFANPKQPLAEAHHAQVKMMIAELPKAPARVMILGYGVGTTARAVRRAGYRVLVVTNDVNEVRIANRAPIEGVTVIESPIELFRVNKTPFDAVIAREVGPLVDMVSVLRGAHLHLAKGGRLIFAEELPAEIAREAGKAAQVVGFSVAKSRTLSEAVVPTLDHYAAILTKHRARMKIEMRLSDDGMDRFLQAISDRRTAFKSGAQDYVLMTLIKT